MQRAGQERESGIRFLMFLSLSYFQSAPIFIIVMTLASSPITPGQEHHYYDNCQPPLIVFIMSFTKIVIQHQIIIDTHWARLIVEFYAAIKMGGAVSCHSVLCKELVILRILNTKSSFNLNDKLNFCFVWSVLIVFKTIFWHQNEDEFQQIILLSDHARFIDVSKHFNQVLKLVVIKLLWIVTRIRDDNPPFFLSSLEILKWN